MIKLKWHMVLVLFFFSAFALSAQTAAELDKMLETNAVSVAGAARFVLGALEQLPPGLSGAEAEKAAFDMASSKGWVISPAASDITLRETAFLVMNAFDFEGGLMYSLFASPRYAYREMVYKRIIQGRADPSFTVSGHRLLLIIGRALSFSGRD